MISNAVNNETARGWDSGDELIRKIAVALSMSLKLNPDRPARLFRIGGDEVCHCLSRGRRGGASRQVRGKFGVHRLDAVDADGEPAGIFFTSITGGIGKDELSANEEARSRKTARKLGMRAEFSTAEIWNESNGSMNSIHERQKLNCRRTLSG